MADPTPSTANLPLTLRFRVGPFPVAVEPTFWLLALMVFSRTAWLSLAWAAVTFASVLVHELGHAYAARRYGAGASIRLHALGGLTFHDPLPHRRQRILVSLAGPGAGFAFGLLALAVQQFVPLSAPRPVLFTLDALVWVNFGWGV